MRFVLPAPDGRAERIAKILPDGSAGKGSAGGKPTRGGVAPLKYCSRGWEILGFSPGEGLGIMIIGGVSRGIGARFYAICDKDWQCGFDAFGRCEA